MIDSEILIACSMLLGSFIFFLVLGLPVAIAIMVSSIFTLIFSMSVGDILYSGSQKMFTGINNFGLLAAPFFILSGNLMNKGGIARRLVNLAMLLGGRIPGSLAHANVISNMLFRSVCGSSVAAASAVGGFMGPLQKEKNYDPYFSAAVNIASAPTGLLIPPTGLFIVFSLMTGTSVATLFVAGYVPGILMGLGVMFYAWIYAKKHNYPVEDKVPLKQALRIVFDAIPSLLMIVVVIGGIIVGIFTATEGGVISVFYGLILSLCYGTIKPKDLPAIMIESAIISGMILFLIAASSFMSWAMTWLSIPDTVSELLLSVSENPIIILLIMNLLLVIVGTFMDISPALLIFTPIFFPITQSIGMDPIHFGVMLVFNLCIGNITPPVGSALFVGCSIANVPMEKVIKPLLPIFAIEFILLLVVTYIPEISLFLPHLFGMS